jgi:tetratricopeptide (TPR) repeat protein
MIKSVFTRSARTRRLACSCLMGVASVTALYMLPVTNAVVPGLFASQVQAAEEEGRRPPPSTRQAGTLTQQVFSRITKVMELRDMDDLAGAKAVLDEIRALYDRGRLNDFETFTLWQFYASIEQTEENYEGALTYYRRMLEVPNLSPDQIEQTWFYIGSFHFVLEQYREAIDAFEMYNQIALEPNDAVYLRIASAYYSIEEYRNALPPLLKNMELLRAKGEKVPQSTYGLLRAIYLTLEDYQSAYQTLREMVVLFEDPADWSLLAQLAGQLERFTEQAQIYYVAETGGFLDSENEYVQLASQLFNNENPYGCAEMIQKGFDKGIIEEDEDNLSFIAQCYQIAREDEKALPFLERAAAMSDDGELYARLARVYMTLDNMEKAAEAFKEAFDKGGLNRPDQVYLTQARAYMELNRYDEALTAARAAGRDERSADTARTWVTVLTNEKERYETLQRQRRDLAEFIRPAR